MEVGEKKKARSEFHLIKANHGVAKRRKPWTTLPQFLPIGLTETLIQPLDRNTKTKRELFIAVLDIPKLTCRINTRVNSEKLLFATNVRYTRHEALFWDRLVALNTHAPLSFALKVLVRSLFSLIHLGGSLERLRRGNNILMDPMAMTGNGSK